MIYAYAVWQLCVYYNKEVKDHNSMRIVEAVKSFSKVQSKHNFATQITK